MSADTWKRQAAEKALLSVQPGMRLGLGTGSTAALFVELLGERVAAGLVVTCVPTSEATRAHAARLGIPLATLDEFPRLDLTVDGNNLLDTYFYHFTDKDAQRNLEYYHTGRVITFGARLKF